MPPPPWTPSPPLPPLSSIATSDKAILASLQRPGSQQLTSNVYMQLPTWLLTDKPHLPGAGPADLFDLPDEGASDAERDSNAGSAQEDGDGGFGMVEHDSDAATILYSTLKGRCGLNSRP